MATYEEYRSTSKTGQSIAYRCPFCGEVTICDILVTDSESKMEGITYDSDVKHSMVCRLCGVGYNVPQGVKPVTWEEFQFALASDDLIEQSNPAARDQEIPSLAEAGLPAIAGESRAVVAMLSLLSRPMWKEQMTFLTLGASVVVASIVFFVVNNQIGATIVKSLIWVVLTLVIGAAISFVVNKLRRAPAMADEYDTRVDRFCSETGTSLEDLTRIASKHEPFAMAVPVLAELAKGD